MVKNRIVHLDMKGLQPTPERLVELPRIFNAAGYNGILLEWENAFPWKADVRFRSPTAYTLDEINEFYEKCAFFAIKIIPLVQCLGHMESFLRLEDYSHLREVSQRHDCLNPLADGAGTLVERIVDEIMANSPELDYFHLGGDEVYVFGDNPLTKKYIQEHGKAELYIKHYELLLDKLNSMGIRPILWHDMMRDWDEQSLRELGTKADLMVWGYNGSPMDEHRHFHVGVIEKFIGCGIDVWGATAYKGADGRSADLPIYNARCQNAAAWAEVAEKFNLKGLVTTAWSRYATYRPQCEPLDAALDILFVVGEIIKSGRIPESEDHIMAMLESIDEKNRFLACRNVLKKFSDHRKNAWGMIQDLKEQQVLERLEPARRHSKETQELLFDLTHQIAIIKKNALEVQGVFQGLVTENCLQEYLNVRVQAIADELNRFQNQEKPS